MNDLEEWVDEGDVHMYKPSPEEQEVLDAINTASMDFLKRVVPLMSKMDGIVRRLMAYELPWEDNAEHLTSYDGKRRLSIEEAVELKHGAWRDEINELFHSLGVEEEVVGSWASERVPDRVYALTPHCSTCYSTTCYGCDG